jgi:predicted metalloprotease
MRLGNSRRSSNVVDARRGGGRRASLGIGGLLLLLVGAIFGLDLRDVVGLTGGGAQQTAEPADANDAGNDFLRAVLGDTEQVWGQLFSESGSRYPEPVLVRFEGVTRSACGVAQSATGPFYCPADQRLYIDLTFFRELARLGAQGDFAAAYVIAHEVGHHVQNVQGILGEVQRRQQRLPAREANALSVRTELQADCYAGVWGHYAQRDRNLLEPGDLEEGLAAAAAVGDDHIQRSAGQAAMPESFTHGTSAQRVQAFRAGFETGDPASCDTFR